MKSLRAIDGPSLRDGGGAHRDAQEAHRVRNLERLAGAALEGHLLVLAEDLDEVVGLRIDAGGGHDLLRRERLFGGLLLFAVHRVLEDRQGLSILALGLLVLLRVQLDRHGVSPEVKAASSGTRAFELLSRRWGTIPI